MAFEEYVYVTYGEQVFSPISYNSFRIGPLSMTTKIRDGETPEDAMARAYASLEATARKIYPEAKREFYERFNTSKDASDGIF